MKEEVGEGKVYFTRFSDLVQLRLFDHYFDTLFRQGAHSPGFNSRSIGFCFFGNFMTVLPPAAALNTAQAFVICARDWGRLTTTYRLLGHRQDVATLCPGDALFNNIRNWPRWS